MEDCPLLEMFKRWLGMDLNATCGGGAFSRKVDKGFSTGPFSLACSAVTVLYFVAIQRDVLLSFYPSSQSNILISLGLKAAQSVVTHWFGGDFLCVNVLQN